MAATRFKPADDILIDVDLIARLDLASGLRWLAGLFDLTERKVKSAKSAPAFSLEHGLGMDELAQSGEHWL